MRKILIVFISALTLLFGAVMEEVEIETTDGMEESIGEESISYDFLSKNGVDVPNIITSAGKCYKENSLIIRDYLVQAFNANPSVSDESLIAGAITDLVSKKDDFLAFYAHYCIQIEGFYKMDEEMFAVYEVAKANNDEQTVQDLEVSLRSILATTLVDESVATDGPFKLKE